MVFPPKNDLIYFGKSRKAEMTKFGDEFFKAKKKKKKYINFRKVVNTPVNLLCYQVNKE
jgi:hypothetical protein